MNSYVYRFGLMLFFRQPLEGLLYKYTNVMKGYQYRWFVLNPDSGKLEYFEVNKNT